MRVLPRQVADVDENGNLSYEEFLPVATDIVKVCLLTCLRFSICVYVHVSVAWMHSMCACECGVDA